MRKGIAWMSALLLASNLPAQGPAFSLDDLTRSVQEWMKDNLDERILEALPELDERKARALFSSLQQRLESSNVYDLAPLKDTAVNILPILRSHETTRPYGDWLESHLDYLETADKLWRKKRPAPAKPGQPPPPPPPPPTPQEQREVWDETLENRPLPPRAKLYVPQLKPIFARGGVPPALVWLAEVESSFNPQARSPVGAVGLFQFMPATAQSLGLSLSPVDERTHPEKSAQAASQYLRYLHARFKDWRLALAAYNAGETRVNNLLTNYKTRSFDVIAPSLPSETQMYIPKIEATLREREGVDLRNLKLAGNPWF